MDGSRFDDLTRALGQGASRRKLLRGLVGGLAGILSGAALSQRDADAAGRALVICHATGNPQAPYQSMTIDQAEFNLHARHGDYLRVECCANSDCPNQHGVCGSGVCQNGYCTQLPAAAGSPCDTGLACTANGTCDGAFNCVGSPVVCAETDNPCTTAICSESGGGCIEVPITDGTTCGTGDACFNHVCSAGNCVETPKTSCTGNCHACGGACVDLNTDPDNCQTCGHVCANASECTVATCNSGVCGTAPANGGMTCGAGDACYAQVCASGSCVSVPKTSCTGNCADCDGFCVNLDSDPDHCQACENVCPSDACSTSLCGSGVCLTSPANEGGDCTMEGGVAGTCVSGVCKSSCPTGESCTFPRPNYPNAIGICANGACTCKPNNVPGMCTCSNFSSVAGCCSQGCFCSTGTCIG